jgi:hypothetical protein
MESLLKKLNYKNQQEVLILNLPGELSGLMSSFPADVSKISNPEEISLIKFAMVFVLSQKAVDEVLPHIMNKLEGDSVLWFCYPKKSSKKYSCDFDRDHGWEGLGKHGFEPVKIVSLDNDFSALRFRKVEYIKKITRSREMALTEEGKNRTVKRQ